jgi:hypothetical protein
MTLIMNGLLNAIKPSKKTIFSLIKTTAAIANIIGNLYKQPHPNPPLEDKGRE